MRPDQRGVRPRAPRPEGRIPEAMVTPNPNFPVNGYGWRWKPVDIVVLLLAFAIYWPVGLLVLAWKLWNDRQANPQDLAAVLQTGFVKLQGLVDGVLGSAGPVAAGAAPVTGNAAFDARIREEWARTEAERQRILDEVAAFRSFVAAESTGDRDLYERFRAARQSGRA
jgi:hypothetical protein